MWIITNRGLLSVVADKHDPTGDRLLVRARQREFLADLVEPLTEVFEDQEADYPYRCFMSRADFMDLLAVEVAGVDYPNFKNSVRDDVYHALLSKVWSILSVLGMGRRYGRATRGKQGGLHGLNLDPLITEEDIREFEQAPADEFPEDVPDGFGRRRRRVQR